MTVLPPLAVLCIAACAFWSLHLWRRECRRTGTLCEERDNLDADLSSILANLSSGLLIVDRRSVVQRLNPSARRILALVDEPLEGRPLNDVLLPGHFEFARSVMHVLSGGEAVLRREIELRLDGRPVPVGVSVNPLGDEDDVQGAVALFQDLTEVKRLQRQKSESDRLAALGELSASIAHEIRNPLGSIRGCAEMLAGDPDLRSQNRRLLDLILKESGRVNRIISDFLTFARQPRTQPALIEAVELLDEVALLARIDARESGRTVHIDVQVVPEDMLLYVDGEQIKQVLINLCQNACDAAGTGGRVQLAALLDVPGKVAHLSVSDDGPGVPASERERIFEPFHTTKTAGTGLGLTIVRRIIHAHGGEVGVGEGSDGGARFSITLPLSDRPSGDGPLSPDLLEAAAADMICPAV